MRYGIAAKFTALMLGTLALMGCVSPYAYYGDDGCGGPPGLSVRHAGCGVAPCDGCDMVAVEPAACDTACADPCVGAGLSCGFSLIGLLQSALSCTAGCGDVYCDEWCYDPPDACDPCDDYGCFVGPQCCGPPCWYRIWEGIRGTRFCPVASPCGPVAGCAVGCTMEPACGCDDCAPNAAPVFDEGFIESPVPMEQLESIPAPQSRLKADRSMVPRRNSTPYYARDPNSRLVRRPGR